MKYPEFKVCVRCFTYNQSNYITDALNGFCMQQTDFPFVCCVVDDASTDGEQEVIRKYLLENFVLEDSNVSKHYDTAYAEVFYAQHITNKNCYFTVLFLKENLYSKNQNFKKWQYISEWREKCEYEAFCEGDDYWIEPKKLKKQVDILDSNSEYMLTFHNAIVKYQDSTMPDKIMKNFATGIFSTAMIFEKWQLPFGSVMLRISLLNTQIFKDLTKDRCLDICYFIASSVAGKVYGISECMSVYRKNPEGVSNSMSLALCMDINYGLAKITGDKEALETMKKCSEKEFSDNIIGYLRGERPNKELVKVIKKYNPRVLYSAFFLCFRVLLDVFKRKLSNMFHNKIYKK